MLSENVLMGRDVHHHRFSKKIAEKDSAQRRALGVSLMVVGLSAGFVAFVFCAPSASGTSSDARVFAEGVNIKLDRASPAYAALEDAWDTPSTADSAGQPPPPIELSAGSAPATQLAEKIVRANRREETLLKQERTSRQASSQLMAQMAAETLRRMTAGLQAPSEHHLPKSSEPPADVEAKPTVTRTISLSDLKISREELLGSLFLPLAVSPRPQPRVAIAPRQPSRDLERNSRVSRDRRQSPRVSTESLASCGSQPTLRQVVISGPLEFTDGLALANSLDRVVVFRQVDGEQIESGAVWLRQGRYELFAEENAGQIVGELRTPYGDVVGRGSLDLACAPPTPDGQSRISGVKLSIHPVPQGLGGRVTAHDRPIPGANVVFRDLPFATKTGKDGRFEETHLLEGSNAIVAVDRPGYWGTLTFARTGADNQLDLISSRDDQMIRNMMSVAMARAGQSDSKSSAIIWGRVTQGGKPIAGARVELLTTASVVHPIYFNAALLPDPNLTQTSANGMYAFFPVPQGAHAVQAVTGVDQATEPVIFPAEEKMISRMDIETAIVRQAKIKVFDAFATDRPLAAELSSPGSSQPRRVDRGGVGTINYAENRSLLIIDSEAGAGYRTVRVATSRDRSTIYIPMISNAWIEDMRGRYKMNTEPGSGAIVGFVQGSSPYKIALEERSLTLSSRVIYFNTRGEPSENDFGEPGGGFVIFNVPEGFRTVTVQPSGSSKIYASVALVESRVVNVISHWIR